MKTQLLYLLFFFIIIQQPFAQTDTLKQGSDTIQARVILIGDAGASINGKHPVITAARSTTPFDEKTVVLYLGDNLYKEGLPDEQYSTYGAAKAVLDSQIKIADASKARLYFIPGNHDWNDGGRYGLENVVRQQRYIDGLGKSNIAYYPKEGCPGPVEIPVSKDVVIVVFDSQWWLHPFDKPGIESDCDTKTQGEILSQLEDILSRNAKKLVLLACHHPFKSYGIHGGYFTIKQHIFPFTDMKKNLYIPLPVIGSVYPITRSIFGNIQDLPHPAYKNMINAVQEVAKGHPNVIFVAGHEHNQQLIRDSNYTYIVSGGGCKKSRVSKGRHAEYVAEENGFATLEISNNKNVRVNFYEVNDSIRQAHTANLFNFSKIQEEQIVKDSVTAIEIDYNNNVKVAARPKFDSASGFKRFFLGNNYRKEWATPVEVKKFNLRSEKGGFTIKGLGGGKQTKSLRLVDKNGREWALRTIKKDPEKVVPANFRNSLAEDIVQDYISASHPYGSLTVYDMAKAIGVTQANPELFFVPDDPAFGFYRPLFANTLCFLEQRDPTPDNSDTKSTAKTIENMLEDNDNRVDQEAVLKARLLDILIADWDRHFDQWKFGVKDTGKGKLYYPIPRDRDQAYFWSDGLLLKYFSRNKLPFLKGFRHNIPKVNELGFSSRDFDRIFLNKLESQDWERLIKEVQTKITDGIIENAIKKLPPEIYALDGQMMIDKLKGRRNYLASEGIKYHKFLSKYVDVVGSNKKEYFKISQKDEHLLVQVYKRTDETNTASLMYERRFDPAITDEVRLYGLNGDDLFEIEEAAKASIKLRMIGGKGEDTFNIKGSVRNYLYDINMEKNALLHTSRTRKKFSDYPSVNQYDVTSYVYDVNRFPQINIGFNAEDRLMLGVGYTHINHGFRKEPYASKQKLSSLFALNNGSYRIRYAGEFNHLLGSLDLMVNGDFVNPVLNNFFGLGNETINDPSKGREFYRVRYNYAQADILLRRRLVDFFHVSLGPTFFHYWNHHKDNAGKILDNPSLIGLDSNEVYAKKTYVGGKLNILINNLEDEFFPTRGIVWVTELSTLAGVEGKSKPLTRLTSDMTVYGALTDPAKLIAILRVGGGHIFSENYEYFQALNLGQNNFLRGFRKNRFSGSSLAYASLEIRTKLFDSKLYALPGDVGIFGFGDIGRVWVRNEVSKKWHPAVGGGLYYAAFKSLLISAGLGYSEEEKLFNFTLGTRFNLTF